VRREVLAPIAGSVWSHVASVGQHVEVGEVLLIEECMKTEIPVEAPVAGTITWLKACGETIETDDVVATIDVT
jgi:biotin carboxyl carrier protein